MNRGHCVYLGVGNMGFAVLKATLPYFSASWNVTVVDKSDCSIARAASLGVQQFSDEIPKDTDILILGIRPQDLNKLEISTHNPALIVSMMAGVSCAEINRYFPDAQVVRCMPNTPCEFNAGITPVYYNGQNNHFYQSFIEAAQNLGELFFVESEQKIDAATGISGGGPAYMMIIADAMMQACREMGFDEHQARRLVGMTMEGSGKLLQKATDNPIQLAEAVMTPGGTTEKGVQVLLQSGIESTLIQALSQASHKARDMATEENRS